MRKRGMLLSCAKATACQSAVAAGLGYTYPYRGVRALPRAFSQDRVMNLPPQSILERTSQMRQGYNSIGKGGEKVRETSRAGER